MNCTPDKIESLAANEVFVFGSNLRGSHGGGAALVAVQKFGATQGEAEGHQGQSYALPTLNANYEKLPLHTIERHIGKFVDYAASRPELIFLVTQVGCGIAGFKTEEIASLFTAQTLPANVILPEAFHLGGIQG
jgi:hypothetical protein